MKYWFLFYFTTVYSNRNEFDKYHRHQCIVWSQSVKIQVLTKLGQLIHGEVGTFDTELCLNSEQEVTEVELGLESRKPQTFLPMYTGFKNVELTKSTEWSKTLLSHFIYTIHHSIINISFGHRIRPILIVWH